VSIAARQRRTFWPKNRTPDAARLQPTPQQRPQPSGAHFVTIRGIFGRSLELLVNFAATPGKESGCGAHLRTMHHTTCCTCTAGCHMLLLLRRRRRCAAAPQSARATRHSPVEAVAATPLANRSRVRVLLTQR